MIILYPEILLPKQERISISKFTALHDIGKLAIPKDILNKPGALDEREWEIMKTHTLRGAEIVGQFPVLQENPEWSKIISDICKYHHERIDGKGYPDGLKGDEIPLHAQVVGVADVYDALTSERPYKYACSHETALRMILHGECGAFSERILTSLIAASEKKTWYRKAEPPLDIVDRSMI